MPISQDTQANAPSASAAGSRTASAYEAIRAAIVSGHFGPGVQLKEELLARELHCSRTPIKQALGKLVTEGLAREILHTGVFVRKLTLEEIAELMVFRRAIESSAAALAAERATPEDVRELERMAIELDRLNNKDSGSLRLWRAQIEFHGRVVQLSGNDELQRVGERAQSLYFTLFFSTYGFSLMGAQQDIVRTHFDVAAGIGAGDPLKAFAATWAHFEPMVKRMRTEMGKMGTQYFCPGEEPTQKGHLFPGQKFCVPICGPLVAPG